MKKKNNIEDFAVYKERVIAIMQCFKIGEVALEEYLGVRRWQTLIYYMPNQEKLNLFAKFCDVSVDFLIKKSIESYRPKEVEILIYIEKKAIKEEIKMIKRDFLKFYNLKSQQYIN